MFKAILFDLDGTLLNTIDDIADSMNAVLVDMGFESHSVAEYQIFVGDGVHNLAKRALPLDHRDQETVHHCVMRMKAEYEKRAQNKTAPYEGIVELLKRLQEREIKTAILSNKPHHATIDVVKHYFQDFHFDRVYGAFPDTPVKPDPILANRVVEELGLNASDFLYLGDTATDMQTAINSRMYPVGALWGFRTRDELISSGAQKLLAHPLELLDCL